METLRRLRIDRTAVRDENVPFEDYAEVLLLARDYERAALAEREDVAPHKVVRAVMLVERLRGQVIRYVVLDEYIRRALVEIYSPSAVAVHFDVVYAVAADNGALLMSECVDTAHVGQQGLSDVVDVVALDADMVGRVSGVTPDPAAGDAGVVAVVDMVVRQVAVIRVAQDDSAGVHVYAAVVVDMVADNLDFMLYIRLDIVDLLAVRISRAPIRLL